MPNLLHMHIQGSLLPFLPACPELGVDDRKQIRLRLGMKPVYIHKIWPYPFYFPSVVNKKTDSVPSLGMGEEVVYLPVSAVLATEVARYVLMADEVVQQAIRLFDHVTTAQVGIGAIEPFPLLAQSGNIFAQQELELLCHETVVGDKLMRFYDQGGNLVKTGLENRVISMSLEQLRRTSRAVGVAGGSRKYAGILGALRGHWINILITDYFTARWLAKE